MNYVAIYFITWRALRLCKSFWVTMNKIFMYARPCSIKWRVQFHFSCKMSAEFSASSIFFKFRQCEDYSEQSKPYSERLTFAWQGCLLQSKYFEFVCLHFHRVFVLCFATFSLQFTLIRRTEFFIDNFRDQVKRFRSTVAYSVTRLTVA